MESLHMLLFFLEKKGARANIEKLFSNRELFFPTPIYFLWIDGRSILSVNSPSIYSPSTYPEISSFSDL
ncbi:MAG: hypothetical protein C0179_04485 [Fervidicoccus sp.]|nr:MAG: hypothetical protein C0179_04485 [Fervidicoccus sp.]